MTSCISESDRLATRHLHMSVSGRPEGAGPAGDGRSGSAFVGVQALRAVAALLVVVLHADEMWHIRLDPAHTLDFWNGGGAGVDIFFVISGFVMMVSSHKLVNIRGGWRIFVRRRFARIVPYYWLITSIKAASVLAVPALALHTVMQPGILVASYLFIPWRGPLGEIGPVLPVGWTLNFEVAFYAIVAIALASGLGLPRVVLPCLLIAASLSLLATPDWPSIAFYCDPVVIDFGAGLCLGALTLRQWRPSAAVSGIALVAGFLAILFLPPVLPRLVSWGLPAALMVAGTLGLEAWLRPRLPRWLLRLGDASYSIYLTHGFCLAALGVILQRLTPSLTVVGAVMVGTVLSAMVGLLAYNLVERPLLAAPKRWKRLGIARATFPVAPSSDEAEGMPR